MEDKEREFFIRECKKAGIAIGILLIIVVMLLFFINE
jgi:hypothetical protein